MLSKFPDLENDFDMNIYKMLRLVSRKSLPAPLKRLGLWAMLVGRRRMIGVFIDPAMACNLQCRMCYFSDPEKRREMHGVIDAAQLDRVERALFHRALKLQIGCGAEPTLYRDLPALIARGKAAGIPYISITTNGQLIASGRVSLREMVDAGLDEITLSLHGTRRETYEALMPGAKFDLLLELIRLLAQSKRESGRPVLRLNFTVNSLNLNDLKGDGFWKIWDEAGCRPDIVQLRPVQKIGESSWDDFDLTPLRQEYDATIGNVVAECARRGITCIAPTPDEISEVVSAQDGTSALIEDVTYCYVTPDSIYKPDFNLDHDTFETYHRRHHTARRLLKAVVCGPDSRARRKTKKLNYTVR